MKKLLAVYLDLPESTNLEESLDFIYTMEEEIKDLQVKFKISLTEHCKAPNSDNVPMTVHEPKLKIPDFPCLNFQRYGTLDKTLKSFWEIENVTCDSSPISEELNYCNEHCEKTHYRNSEDIWYKCPLNLKLKKLFWVIPIK
ncbi:hypothetical protein AVEN_61712-1 [Araneus ventricosus]|uniref:Uncharacterized protein n=1 Tax=Araneus ventricosus TaxID=182803 RepID=A0A4Y2JAP3_ARAVE|nr:hypothetical protein AVEN_61712-1 [Araneus ventricosus]